MAGLVGPRTGGSSKARDGRVGTLWPEAQLRARLRSSQSERQGAWHPTSVRAPAGVLVTTSQPPARSPQGHVLPASPPSLVSTQTTRAGRPQGDPAAPSQQPGSPPRPGVGLPECRGPALARHVPRPQALPPAHPSLGTGTWGRVWEGDPSSSAPPGSAHPTLSDLLGDDEALRARVACVAHSLGPRHPR